MKTIIIFASKYGSTRLYSNWLCQETGYPVVWYKDFDTSDFKKFDRVVIGSSVHMGKLDISNWMSRNWKHMIDKEVILFSVNGTPPDHTQELQSILDYSLRKEIQDKITYFPLQGRLVYSQLNLWHKLLIKMMKQMNKQPEPNFVIEDYDNVRKENLAQLKNHLAHP